MSEQWHIHFAGDQRIKWALDEDLRWAREALAERAVFCPLPGARIVHAAWWPELKAIGFSALEGKTVVCFADNPPALYLTLPEFAEAAARVDLWIARSREAQAQFQALGLPVALAPYCVDGEVFRPLDEAPAIRGELGLAEDTFVIGNFHRDSEGSDLRRPKKQKGPDLLFEIARELHRRLPQTCVLLAGPRRHWLRARLASAGIPFLFVGQDTGEADDFETNILSREQLNRLYQALDACVISSRWEGGPYSALESLFAGRPVISTPVGIARDVIPDSCLYRSIDEAVALLEDHVRTGFLRKPLSAARANARRVAGLEALRSGLLHAYRDLPTGPAGAVQTAFSGLRWVKNRFLGDRQTTPKSSEIASLIASLPPVTGRSPIIEFDFQEDPLRALLDCAGRIKATKS